MKNQRKRLKKICLIGWLEKNTEEEARQQALLRKILKVLQWELPRPLTASLDEMIRKELLTLLEHDNAKYPLEKKLNKEKKRGFKCSVNASAVPEIDDFEEEELKEV
nr:cell division cycle 5-like protein [Quercus suber]